MAESVPSIDALETGEYTDKFCIDTVQSIAVLAITKRYGSRRRQRPGFRRRPLIAYTEKDGVSAFQRGIRSFPPDCESGALRGGDPTR